MTKASDNDYPSVLLTEQGSAPSSPAASHQRLYIRTSDHTLVTVNSSGTVAPVGSGSAGIATDTIWAAQGDIAVATGNDAAAVLTKGATGTVPTAGASTLAYAYPPGYEFDYAQVTSNYTTTATTEATATAIVTGNSVAYDGSTVVLIEFCAQSGAPNASGGAFMYFILYDGSSSIGRFGFLRTPAAASMDIPLRLARRITPSAASHTYSIRAYVSTGTGGVDAGAGGNAASQPAFIRITKV